MLSDELKKRLKELVENAIEYDVITEDDNLGGYVFEDEMIGSDISSIVSLLEEDKKLLSKITDLVKQYEQDEEEQDEDPIDSADEDKYSYDCE